MRSWGHDGLSRDKIIGKKQQTGKSAVWWGGVQGLRRGGNRHEIVGGTYPEENVAAVSTGACESPARHALGPQGFGRTGGKWGALKTCRIGARETSPEAKHAGKDSVSTLQNCPLELQLSSFFELGLLFCYAREEQFYRPMFERKQVK